MTVAKKGSLSIEQVNELQIAKGKNKDKNADARLRALLLYAEGQTSKEIAAKTGFKDSYITDAPIIPFRNPVHQSPFLRG